MLDDDDGTADDPDSTAAVAENSEAILRVAEAVAMLQIKFDQREKERELDYQAQKGGCEVNNGGWWWCSCNSHGSNGRATMPIGYQHRLTPLLPPPHRKSERWELLEKAIMTRRLCWMRPLKALPHASPRKAVSPKRTNNPNPRSSPAYAWLY